MDIGLAFLASYPDLLTALVEGLGISRSFIKKQIPFKRLISQKVTPHKEFLIPIDLLNRNIINDQYQGDRMEIIYQDRDFLVINKLPFVHSHPLCYSDTQNCLSFLRNEGLGQFLNVNGDHYDRGLLYRLDFETSGVLVYVKNEVLHQELRRNFHQLVKKKVYLAIVPGNFKKTGHHLHYLRPGMEKGKKMLGVENGRSRDASMAQLHVENLKYSQVYDKSLLRVTLETGIRHQIRAQMALLGHPLVGDLLYGGEKGRRIYLHAFEYQVSAGGRNYSFQCQQALFFDDFFHFDGLFNVVEDAPLVS